MKTIDTKSLLIGILATVLVMVTIGAASITAVPMAEVGRYKYQGGGGLLDTVTGNVYKDNRLNNWVLHISIKQKD